MHLRRLMTWGLCCALAGPVLLHGQGMESMHAAQATGATVAPSTSLNELLSMMESEVVGAAEAMPADKYDFVPPASYGEFKGVNSFSSQVKHLAQANYAFFRGWGVPGSPNIKAIGAMTTKDQIVQALKDSYAYAHKAIDTITPQNAFVSQPGPEGRPMTRVATASFSMAHSMDHYGQMVEYLRMNGIIPPASRPRGSH